MSGGKYNKQQVTLKWGQPTSCRERKAIVLWIYSKHWLWTRRYKRSQKNGLTWHKALPLPLPLSAISAATMRIRHLPKICSNTRFSFPLTWIQSQWNLYKRCAASGHIYICTMDRWRSQLPYVNIIGGVSMKQHPRLSLAFTLGTGIFLSLKQTHSTYLHTTEPGNRVQSTSIQVEERPSSPTRKGTWHHPGR